MKNTTKQTKLWRMQPDWETRWESPPCNCCSGARGTYIRFQCIPSLLLPGRDWSFSWRALLGIKCVPHFPQTPLYFSVTLFSWCCWLCPLLSLRSGLPSHCAKMIFKWFMLTKETFKIVLCNFDLMSNQRYPLLCSLERHF